MAAPPRTPLPPRLGRPLRPKPARRDVALQHDRPHHLAGHGARQPRLGVHVRYRLERRVRGVRQARQGGTDEGAPLGTTAQSGPTQCVALAVRVPRGGGGERMPDDPASEPRHDRPPSGAVVAPLPPGLRPAGVVHEGRYARLEPLDARVHAAELYAASHADETARQLWRYLPNGPYES